MATKPAPVEVQDRLLRIESVKEMVGLGKTMIYRKVREGTFPPPFKPGGAASRWSEREVIEWRAKLSIARAG